MEETNKQPPVDRGKLLIGLPGCCPPSKCKKCTYNWDDDCFGSAARDVLKYIRYLEEQLGVTGL